MAVIYSYPKATPTASDLLIGTLTSDASGENPTKTFSISDIIGLVPAAGTGGTVTSIGLTNTDNFLTISNSPITTSGNITVEPQVQTHFTEVMGNGLFPQILFLIHIH
jgi:hypothetical protein